MRGLIIRLILLSAIALFASPAEAEFQRATLQGKATLGCPAGQFWDPRGECWSCPAGSNRTLYPVTSERACSQPAGEKLSKATFHQKTGCGAGEFFDPRNGGECWQCPADRPRRTLYPVTDERACATKEIFGEKLSKATFKGKVGQCTGSQFFDPRNGGECWSCPASEPRRTLYPVTDAKACASKEILSENLSKATFGSKSVPFACPAGQFWDPRNLGECWACPASHPYRTVNPVYEDKSCTNKPGEIFVPDPKFLCHLGVNALAGMYKGVKQAQDEVDKFLAVINDAVSPALKPIEKELAKLDQTIRSATQLDKLLSDAANAVRNDAFDQAFRAGDVLNSQSDKLIQILLDDKLVCDGNQIATLGARLQSIGLGPAPKPASLGDFFVRSAHASSPAPRNMMGYSISAGGTLKSPPIGVSLGLSFMTDYREMHGLYFFIGPQASSARNVIGGSLGAMAFAQAALGDPDLTTLMPGLQLSLSPGSKLDDFFVKYLKKAAKAVPSSLDLSMDLAPTLSGGPPTFGIGLSKGLDWKFVTNEEKKNWQAVDLTISGSWAVPIWQKLPPPTK